MSYLDKLFSVVGKTALVTGAATGIGRMVATGLVQAGATVMIASRKGEDCVRVADEINAQGGSGRTEGFAGDVSSEAGIAALVAEVKVRTDRLHILVNNAGISWGAPLAEFPYHAWTKVLGVNVTAVFHLTRELLPLLDAAASDDDPARVINLGSVMGTQPLADDAYSYTAS
ncbi:MAG: SDR family NAD(P)-dependent oxidoreductase, partial [Mesorhizobium sp.]